MQATATESPVPIYHPPASADAREKRLEHPEILSHLLRA
jgi:hypothetical protein